MATVVMCRVRNPALQKRPWEGALYKWLTKSASDAMHIALYKWSTFTFCFLKNEAQSFQNWMVRVVRSFWRFYLIWCSTTTHKWSLRLSSSSSGTSVRSRRLSRLLNRSRDLDDHLLHYKVAVKKAWDFIIIINNNIFYYYNNNIFIIIIIIFFIIIIKANVFNLLTKN